MIILICDQGKNCYVVFWFWFLYNLPSPGRSLILLSAMLSCSRAMCGQWLVIRTAQVQKHIQWAPQSQLMKPNMLIGQTALCEQLVPVSPSTAMWHLFLQAQKKPAILCGFLLETTIFMKSNSSRIRIAACALAGEWTDSYAPTQGES